MSTDFGADSSSRFPFRARTNKQTNKQTHIRTDKQTRLDALPTPAAIQSGVGNNKTNDVDDDNIQIHLTEKA